MPGRKSDADLKFALSLFRDALGTRGCVLCRTLLQAERRSLFTFLYEGMGAPHARERFLEGGGFCPRHFWWVMHVGHNRWGVGPVELAELCRQLVPRAAAAIAAAGKSRPRARALPFARARKNKQELPASVPGAGCIFCREWLEREPRLVALLEKLLDQEEFSRALAAHGLCFRHACLAVAAWQQPGKRRQLSEILRARSDQLVADLAEYLRKQDHRFRDEPFGREADVVERAVEFLAGLDLARPEADRAAHRISRGGKSESSDAPGPSS
jgi:Family of unknown function (DUF6062)